MVITAVINQKNRIMVCLLFIVLCVLKELSLHTSDRRERGYQKKTPTHLNDEWAFF